MKFKVRLFGYLAEYAGSDALEVESKANVRSVVTAVQKQNSKLARLDSSVKFAVNADYADEDTALKAGDVVSLIPPVGGG